MMTCQKCGAKKVSDRPGWYTWECFSYRHSDGRVWQSPQCILGERDQLKLLVEQADGRERDVRQILDTCVGEQEALWKEVDRLKQLVAELTYYAKRFSGLAHDWGPEQLKKYKDVIIRADAVTDLARDLAEQEPYAGDTQHPDGYEGPCGCKLCMSYGSE